jgi:hypothetical protein
MEIGHRPDRKHPGQAHRRPVLQISTQEQTPRHWISSRAIRKEAEPALLFDGEDMAMLIWLCSRLVLPA